MSGSNEGQVYPLSGGQGDAVEKLLQQRAEPRKVWGT